VRTLKTIAVLMILAGIGLLSAFWTWLLS